MIQQPVVGFRKRSRQQAQERDLEPVLRDALLHQRVPDRLKDLRQRLVVGQVGAVLAAGRHAVESHPDDHRGYHDLRPAAAEPRASSSPAAAPDHPRHRLAAQDQDVPASGLRRALLPALLEDRPQPFQVHRTLDRPQGLGALHGPDVRPVYAAARGVHVAAVSEHQAAEACLVCRAPGGVIRRNPS
ncbi:hypothetical protein PG985_007351 [Apiospora marii]|uniref:Uncharacterized protein n=1 Tax=Apiospora marii TaxID=335849 RepID=A0ABR1SQK6_9PEZI